MFLSRECDYAIRIVRALAGGGIKNIKQICEEEAVPQPYAYKIMKKLVEHDVVCSYRGVLGGYELVRSVDELTLHDVVVSVDEGLVINDCFTEGYACTVYKRVEKCPVHCELARIQNSLMENLKAKSIGEILAT
jgi:Rrf2 family protein